MAKAHKSKLASAALAVRDQRSPGPASWLWPLLALALMSALVPLAITARLECVAAILAIPPILSLGRSAVSAMGTELIGLPRRCVSLAAASRTGSCSELSLQQPIAQ